jgi:hypothetical protein
MLIRVRTSLTDKCFLRDLPMFGAMATFSSVPMCSNMPQLMMISNDGLSGGPARGQDVAIPEPHGKRSGLINSIS